MTARRGLFVGLLCSVLAFVAGPVQAQDCSDYGGVLDGFAGDVAPSQLQIDQTCTIRNFPASNPLRTNFSFFTQPGQNDERWLVVFDNVVHTGQMSCNSVLEHKIWFTNGSSTTIQEGCQNLLIPVEKIDKQTPPGQTAATIGVPFTYTLTMPVLFDPATGTVIDNFGSANDLHGVTVTDDLNATGADLSYVSHQAYWEDTGTPVPHTFDNSGGLLTFDNFPIVSAGRQIILEITVVLEDTPGNSVGTQFVNTAKWDFGRLIEGVFYEPLPGEWGISPPLTIDGPQLQVTKTGPATLGRTLNIGEWGDFAIDVENTGLTDAWNATIIDRLPRTGQGGMCDTPPEVSGAQVFAADGVTPAPGKGPLVEGIDYALNFTGAPFCELELTLLTAAATIGPGERLIIDYRARVDEDSQDGITLTNVVGATEWFNDDSSNAERVAYTRVVTNGTVGQLDHQDAHTVTVALRGYFFEKTVQNLSTGENPATTVTPGETLRYTLRLQATDLPLNDFEFFDDLGELNATAVFVPGSLTFVPGSIPPGADTSNTNPFGGTNGAGIVDVRDLDIATYSDVSIRFDVTVDPTLGNGIVITNQADLISGVKIADSDDPTVNGLADPDIPGDEDPTQVLVEVEPSPALQKTNTQAPATIGETFGYLITVPAAPHTEPLYDVRILDDLGASAADLEYVDVTRVAGPGSWTPVNTGTATSLVIEDVVDGIDIPAGEQVVVEVTVRLSDTPTNVAGLTFVNTAAYTHNLLDGNAATERPGAPATTQPMTVVEPELTLSKTGPPLLLPGVPGTFTLDVQNTGGAPAFGMTLTDVLPDTPDGGMCAAAPVLLTAQVFEADGATPVGPALVAGTDISFVIGGSPACTLTIEALTPAAAVGPDQRLILTYRATVDTDTLENTVLTNIAGVTTWFSGDAAAVPDDLREYSRLVTDGTPGTTDHEDVHSLIVNEAVLRFEKTVANLTRGTDPGVLATPGDTLRYRIELENQSDAVLTGLGIVDELDRLNGVPAFQSGTLNLTVVPSGADTGNTSPTGGQNGTGLVDVGGLTLSGLGDSIVVEFEVVLAGVLPNGMDVLNQSQLTFSGVTIAQTDDPNVNGTADPDVFGDEDPTSIQIESAPEFDVDKISEDVTGDPAMLLAGETLRYTITVKNIGTDNATDTVFRDAIPPNTAYVAGSTTLNGIAVPDPGPGVAPVSQGMSIYAPENLTPGAMRADPSATVDNVATIVFDVILDANLIDGTVISNQGFVSAVAGGVSDQPSDDPDTPIADDPTRDVVGALPLIYAEKSAVLEVDLGSPNIVDPGDVLRYTITVYNNGSRPATEVVLTDTVPANTSYVADSTTQNGLPVGQPDGGSAPLAAGIPLGSSDLTPPLPGPGAGTLTPGESSVITFDLLVDAAATPGTLIVNQASVSSSELADVPTDGDGNPATGPEPTVVVVGDAQQLSITKEVAVVGGGPAVAGATLEYTIRVLNVSPVPATLVTISDDLDLPVAGQLAYVDQSATMNGTSAGVTFAGSLLTADYGGTHGPLAPDEEVLVRFQAVLGPSLPIGATVVNGADVQWNDPPQSASASVSLTVGGEIGSGVMSGSAWHDSNFDDVRDTGERPLSGWTVELLRNGQPLHTTVTDAAGAYRISGIPPNDLTADQYEIRFSSPGAVASTAPLGRADSAFTDYLQRIADIVVPSGGVLQDLNLPIDPNGVVYNAVGRTPIAGVRLTLVDAASGVALPTACFDDAAQQNQVTLADGYYKFDVNFSDPACPDGGDYLIELTAPGSSFEPGFSDIIPPSADATTGPLSVPSCPGTFADAIPTTVQYCEAQPSALAPGLSVPARSGATAYYVHLTLDDSQAPGSAQIFNNHLPIDPVLDDAVSISKVTPAVHVTRGQLVPYVITVTNDLGFDLTDVSIVDRFPAGFRYVQGSARLDDQPIEPVIAGREMTWSNLGIAGAGRHTLEMLMAVGAGVSEGDFVNRAQVMHALTGDALSNEASATVRLVPDPDFDCTDVTGKVFDDVNRNGVQDNGETGIPGVRLMTATGLSARTDGYGRFHITCATVPTEGRGSNFVLKLDDRTLPTGYRSSVEPIRVARATRGKALRFSFGASIHRVIGLDISDPVFVPGETEFRPQWSPRIGLLLAELEKAPAVLRLSYLADREDESLVNDRIDAIRRRTLEAWEARGAPYELTVEAEIFWRLGEPADGPAGERVGRR